MSPLPQEEAHSLALPGPAQEVTAKVKNTSQQWPLPEGLLYVT